MPQSNLGISNKTPDEIIHELQQHHLELKIQNEELKQAHQDLEASRDRYINFYDFAPVGYLTLTEDGIIAEVNLTGALMLGVERQNLIQTRFRKFVASGDLDVWDRYFLEILRYEDKKPCDLKLIKQNGIEFSARVEGGRVEISDGAFQIRISVSDDCDRRKVEEAIKTSETRYRRLFESAQEGILILNRETGEITDSNPFIEILTGYSKEELIGKTLWDIGLIQNQIASKMAFDELQSMEYIRYEDLPLETKRGKMIEVEFVSNVYPIDSCSSVIQCNIRDITDRKQTEEALNEASHKLRLLASLTRHDLLNQLSIIQGFNALAMEESDLVANHKYVSRAYQAGVRMEAIIGFTREYEDFGVVSSGWQRIHQIIESSKTEVSLSSVTTENMIPEDLEVYADPIIRKVFTTILENAIRHGGTINRIRFFCSNREDRVIIFCEDDGVGVPLEEKAYIFNHGYGKHTGIGLFLAREILSITSLSILETGIPGKGARFEITVPAGKFRRYNDIH
ncbi:MAG TPA: PAS domain S-box protein [Methanospirillum sp.]|nr:PAS domain S-box protein [Methanospirillum sp.]